jgi:AraC-like DNA-binding protein
MGIDHVHAEMEFNLIVQGSGSWVLEGNSYEIKPGTLIWLLPGQRHRLVRSPKLQMWVVNLRPDLIDAEWMRELAAEPLKQLAGEELVDLDRLLSQVAQDSDEPSVYNSGIAYLIRRVWRASRDSPPASLRPMHPAVSRALMVLRGDTEGISLTALAKEAGVASHYLSRLLIEHTGRSFVDWRNQIRVERFMDAYRSGTSLQDVATLAGFGSYAAFHRVFNEMIGCSPSDWVKQAEHRAAEGGGPKPSPPAADYGLPAAGMMSGRQRWTRLVALVAPAIPALLGESFLDRLTGIDRPTRPDRSGAGGKPQARAALGELDRLDPSLPPDERERLLAPLWASDPVAAGTLARLIEIHDFPGTYARVIGAFGLSTARLPDAVTAVITVTWLAASRASDPGLREVEAVGRQVLAALDDAFARLERRAAQDAHSALLCQFVIVYRALEAARASGMPSAVDQLNAAAAEFGREAFGGDLLSIELGARGFLRRGTERPPGGKSAKRKE